MPKPLPRLRMDLDFMPSPVEDRPGLLIRDPYNYSDATLIVPPFFVPCLELLNGETGEDELRALIVRATGELDVSGFLNHLLDTLSEAGFLEDARFEQMREARWAEFRAAPERRAAHAGAAYPEEEEGVREQLGNWLRRARTSAADGNLVGIAAPHVSPEGGWDSYADAYARLGEELRDRVFVVLGTSHYGEPGRFGLTRKPFRTPFGLARTETALVDELERAAPAAVRMEDYCHSFEHSIEFQVLFLQHRFGPDVRVLPVLCGSFGKSIYFGGRPEDEEPVNAFHGALGEIAAREGKRLCWVLGIDMAHMGMRYGDRFEAREGEEPMREVEARDRARIGRIAAGDADGFWDLVQENRDDLKWCGSAPLYTFLRTLPEARAELDRYQQWNIDDQSVVSFAALRFFRP